MDRHAIRAGRRERWRRRAERFSDAFGLVFALVIVNYVLISLLGDYGWRATVLTVVSSITSVVALVSSHARRRLIWAAVWLSILTIALAALAAISDERTWLNFATTIQILLLAVAMGAVLRRVVTSLEVGSRTILGALSVYAVLGILFTFLYGMVGRIQSAPFFERIPHAHGSDFLFFSYTTLTTTGYGNLVPRGEPGRMIAGLEMMIGQIFLVTLVAGLVSLWRPGEALRKRRTKRPGAGETEASGP
jgi:hypothetical protein